MTKFSIALHRNHQTTRMQAKLTSDLLDSLASLAPKITLCLVSLNLRTVKLVSLQYFVVAGCMEESIAVGAQLLLLKRYTWIDIAANPARPGHSKLLSNDVRLLHLQCISILFARINRYTFIRGILHQI